MGVVGLFLPVTMILLSELAFPVYQPYRHIRVDPDDTTLFPFGYVRYRHTPYHGRQFALRYKCGFRLKRKKKRRTRKQRRHPFPVPQTPKSPPKTYVRARCRNRPDKSNPKLSSSKNRRRRKPPRHSSRHSTTIRNSRTRSRARQGKFKAQPCRTTAEPSAQDLRYERVNKSIEYLNNFIDFASYFDHVCNKTFDGLRRRRGHLHVLGQK